MLCFFCRVVFLRPFVLSFIGLPFVLLLPPHTQSLSDIYGCCLDFSFDFARWFFYSTIFVRTNTHTHNSCIHVLFPLSFFLLSLIQPHKHTRSSSLVPFPFLFCFTFRCCLSGRSLWHNLHTCIFMCGASRERVARTKDEQQQTKMYQ